MIPNEVAILVYQILAILGVNAVSQVVTSIAYMTKDLDYQLMYLQSPIELLLNYNRFNQTVVRKASIVFLTCLSILFQFIPTIMTKLGATVSVYHNFVTWPVTQASASSTYNWPNTMPVFDNFVFFLAKPNQNSFSSMMMAYITETLHQNITENSNGYWFTHRKHDRFEWDNQQMALESGFYAPLLNDTPIGSDTFGSKATAVAFNPQENSSFTTSRCAPSVADNVLTNFSSIRGTTVQAARRILSDCHPMYDSSLVIKTAYTYRTTDIVVKKPSLLNENDTIYRLPMYSEGITGFSSFGVSIYNHNNTHMTLGIKKTAHITLYTLGRYATLPFDCASDSRPDFANNFVDLPYDAVLCSLVDRAGIYPNHLQLVQAASRVYVDNYALNMLYTRSRDDEAVMGDINRTSDALMIDYTLFQAYTVKGNLRDDEEHMVAFSTKNLNYNTGSNKSSAVNISNDKIGALLKELDPTRIDQTTVGILVDMATLRVRWENGDYSNFVVTQAQILNSTSTPFWWIMTMCAMALIFLAPQFISRFVVRRIPEYADSLRNLLLLTIERSSALEGLNNQVKTVGISLRPKDNETDLVALLSVNECIVTAMKKPTGFERRSTDERATSIDESPKHSEGSLPFL